MGCWLVIIKYSLFILYLGKINYLPKLDLNSSNKFENIQQARCLKFKGEVPKDQLEDKLIVEQLYVDYIFRHMLKDCIGKLFIKEQLSITLL